MFGEIIKIIKKAEKIAIFNHVNPDGDALGSAFALKLALLKMGKKAEVFLRQGDDLSKEYKLLKGTKENGLKILDCDLKIALDSADLERLGDFKDVFSGNTIAIDHHITHREFAKTTFIDPKACATGEIIFDLVRELGVSLDEEIAYNLYLAIVCDSGNFKYSSVTGKTHLIAAELLKTGIDFSKMTKALFDTKSIEYLNLYKKGIERLELFEDGKIAVLWFSEEDFKKSGLSEKDADAIVTLPNSVLGVEVGVYIRQREDEYKVSLRSNGNVKVDKIALDFGGGGHEMASGFSMNLPIAEIKEKVTQKIAATIDGE